MATATIQTLDWMMLDRFVFRRDDYALFPDDEATPFMAHHVSSQGAPFVVAFVVSEPPKISRLYLHWPGGLDPKKGSSCDLVAAHRNLLLFRLTSSPVMKDESLFYPQDYFICAAPFSAYQQPLVLHKVPMCTQRSFHLHTVGILCCGIEEFAIAQLGLSRPDLFGKMEAELCVLRSKENNLDHKWEVEQHLPIKYEEHELSDLVRWRTDRVIPFQNYLCWVNYCEGGILFCKVFEERPAISYLRLPIHYRPPGTDLHRFHDMNCSVCITEGGDKLMFVDVAREDKELVGPMSPGTGFTVTCHTLGTTESGGMAWDKIFVIPSDELWDLNTSLPHEALMFPLVSMVKSNVVYFLLSEEGKRGIDNVSVVAIDMITKTVLIHPYIKGEEDLWGKDDDMVRRKSHQLQPFIPFELRNFLGLASSSEGVKKTTKTKSGKQVSVASVSPTIASRQVNVKTAATPSCPAYNTRSRKKLAM